MVRIGILMAVGVLFLASECRAQEGNATPQPAAPAVEVGPAPGCGTCGHAAGHHRLLDWLTHRPLYRPGLCGCCKEPAPCWMPPYLWFVDYCEVGGGSAYPLRLPPKPHPGCAHR